MTIDPQNAAASSKCVSPQDPAYIYKPEQPTVSSIQFFLKLFNSNSLNKKLETKTDKQNTAFQTVSDAIVF